MGYTTGACAATAGKAATQYLVSGSAPDSIDVWLPVGRDATFPVPDVTHGTEIAARAWATSASSL